MKKNILTFAVLICIAFTTNAQQNHKKQNKNEKPEFTIEQQATLAVKKLTLTLVLNEKQQEKMHPLLVTSCSDKQNMMEQKKANKEERPQLTSDEIYAKMIDKLDKQISFQNNVKDILTEDQFKKWHKMQAHKKSNMKDKEKGNERGDTRGDNRDDRRGKSKR
ncbi:hypothetical protein [Flavicella sp.]|uniref:hypothetical protein n=1 Tax=Flavicella sp. TaxID=2957742 RepID=UPI003018123A